MNKVRLRVGYTNLVLDSDDAMKVFALLNKGTLYSYDTRYVKDDEGKSNSVGYIKRFNDEVSLCGVAPEDYAMWKIAGETNE